MACKCPVTDRKSEEFYDGEGGGKGNLPQFIRSNYEYAEKTEYIVDYDGSAEG